MYTAVTGTRNRRTLGNLGLVPAGTRLVYTAQYLITAGQALFSRPLVQMLPKVKAALAQQNLTVEAVSSNTPTWAGGNYAFTLTLRLDGDYSQPQDVQAVADHACYEVFGQLPTASRITQGPGAPAGNSPAYYPGAADNGGDNSGNGSSTPWGWIIGVPLGALLLLKVVRG